MQDAGWIVHVDSILPYSVLGGSLGESLKSQLTKSQTKIEKQEPKQPWTLIRKTHRQWKQVTQSQQTRTKNRRSIINRATRLCTAVIILHCSTYYSSHASVISNGLQWDDEEINKCRLSNACWRLAFVLLIQTEEVLADVYIAWLRSGDSPLILFVV